MKAVAWNKKRAFPPESLKDSETRKRLINPTALHDNNTNDEIRTDNSNGNSTNSSLEDRISNDTIIENNTSVQNAIVDSIGRSLRWLGRGRKDRRDPEPPSPKARQPTGTKFHRIQESNLEDKHLSDSSQREHIGKSNEAFTRVSQTSSEEMAVNNRYTSKVPSPLALSTPTQEDVKRAIKSNLQHGQTPLTPTSPISPISDSSLATSPPGSPPLLTSRVSMSPNRSTALRSAASAIAVSSNRPPNNIQGAPNSFSPGSPTQIPVQGQHLGIVPPLPSANVPPLSPASSMIFERSVQTQQALPEGPWSLLSKEEDDDRDAATVGGRNKVNLIPTHVLTEDHIPSVLEASTMAITAGDDPDQVEIVTHTAHHSMGDSIGTTAASGTGASTSSLSLTMPSSHQSVREQLSNAHFGSARPVTPIHPLQMYPLLEGISEIMEDGAHDEQRRGSHQGTTRAASTPSAAEDHLMGSAYGLDDRDSNSARRLSFVSFADVMHGEQAGSHGLHGPSPPTSECCSPSSPASRVTPKVEAISLPTSASGSTEAVSSQHAGGSSGSETTVVGNLVISKMSSAMRLVGRESTEG
jgi:hypothetical protein